MVEATTNNLPLHQSRCNNTTEVLRLHFAILYGYCYDFAHCTVPMYHVMRIV